jgi:hypothetical protein
MSLCNSQTQSSRKATSIRKYRSMGKRLTNTPVRGELSVLRRTPESIGRTAMMKIEANETRARGRGWLKNDNPPGEPNTATRCGAKTRRGKKCRAPAMSNGRCRMHGGASTGPRTLEGLARSRKANWKHGLYSAEVKAERRCLRRVLEESGALLRRSPIRSASSRGKMSCGSSLCNSQTQSSRKATSIVSIALW